MVVSNQVFAFLLVMECGILALLMIPYYFIRRRSGVAWANLPVYALWSYFLYLLGGGVADRIEAVTRIYLAAFGLLFFQGVLIVVIVYMILMKLYGHAEDDSVESSEQ